MSQLLEELNLNDQAIVTLSPTSAGALAITSGTSAAGVLTDQLAKAKRAMITAIGVKCLFSTVNGVDPTQTLGNAIPVDMSVVVYGNKNINNLKFIGYGGTSNVSITLGW